MDISLQFEEAAELPIGSNDGHTGLAARWICARDQEITILKHAKLQRPERQVEGDGTGVVSVTFEVRNKRSRL